jgi:hypothetical protein
MKRAKQPQIEKTSQFRDSTGIAKFLGTGIWEGDLSEMREDHSGSGARKTRRKQKSPAPRTTA